MIESSLDLQGNSLSLSHYDISGNWVKIIEPPAMYYYTDDEQLQYGFLINYLMTLNAIHCE